MLVEANSTVDANYSGNDTANICGHNTDMSTQPPAYPAEQAYTYQERYLFHTIGLLLF